MKKNLISKLILGIVLVFLISAITVAHTNTNNSYQKVETNIHDVLAYNEENEKESQVLYLSDIPYKKADIAYKTISLDKTTENANLTLRTNGAAVTFKKGIYAHATSTVEYDISKYKDYVNFGVYYGLNTTSTKGNGVKFYIYTSVDGENWTLRTEENPKALTGSDEAVQVTIDIRDANYIRLYANDNGSNASDHAVWGDAKLMKEGYNNNVMKTVLEYDQIIKASYQSGRVPEDLKLTLLQRNFIKNIGQYQLRAFVDDDPKNAETLNWFINNEEALRLWTIGGKPSGSYQKALQILSELYHAHKEDLSNENVTSLGTKYKDLYLKMMLSLSLSHSGSVGLWIGGSQYSNALIRYEIYKDMHKNGLLESNAMFESYTIDEMRGVMATSIDDEEIMWLHDYSKKFSAAYPSRDRFNPYKYINYTLNYNYGKAQYYSQENYPTWNKKYSLSNYNITYLKGKPKLWIVFEEGAVCGGLSKTAANLYGVWGYPARVVGQPRHAAYTYLYDAGNGKNAWQLSYNVIPSGWTNTTGRGTNGWGSKYATSNANISTGSYMLLAQDAQNEYEQYEQAELIVMLQDVYKNDKSKLEQIYLDAIKEERINLDAWIGLMDLYIADSTKTDEDLAKLAEEIAEVYAYHPLPMYDLTKRIAANTTSAAYRSKILMLQNETLKKATKAAKKDTLYYNEVPVIANSLLGLVDTKVASFSYDGADAGKIVLSKQLQSGKTNWSYSLDGGTTWTDVFEGSVQLTKEQIDRITVDNDIKIHILGLPKTEKNIYTINITQRKFPGGITINDEENRIYGATSEMEWSLNPEEGWNSFSNTNPIFNGDVKVAVRVVASGTEIASEPVYYTYTANVYNEDRVYIPYEKIEKVTASATAYGNVKNIIDGNSKTSWRGPKGKQASVIVKLDSTHYITELQITPDSATHENLQTTDPVYCLGLAKTVKISVSLDGETWNAVKTANLSQNLSTKTIKLDAPEKALYVKIESTALYPSGSLPIWASANNSQFSISMLKMYENTSVNETPYAELNYNIVGPTNKDVTVELINPTRPITVTNNDGKTTYTFKENGEFTFEFVDEHGGTGSTTAKVDWIDRTAPKAEVKFSTTELTNENVVATISFDKNVTVLSEDVQLDENPIDKSKILTFLENGTTELIFKDDLGNIGTKTITVDWIDRDVPTAEFEFDDVNLTDKPVTATLKPSEEVTIINNGGKDTYTFNKNGEFTFEFMDKAGNIGSETVKVYWISRMPEFKLNYSTEKFTDQYVTVTLDLEDGYRIMSNNGNNVYTFIENGEFDFQYMDESGITGVITVKVDWMKQVSRGDIDGNGKFNATDLSKLKLHLKGAKKLTGVYLTAADVNRDGKVDDADAEYLSLALAGKVEIK